MSDMFSPQGNRYLSPLQRYKHALDTGDLVSLATVLREAEDDPALERLLLAMHNHYQPLNQSAPSQLELANARQIIAQLGTNAGINHAEPSLFRKRFSLFSTSTEKEAKQMITNDSPQFTSQPDHQGSGPAPQARRRRNTWLQTLAAVLVVCALIGGFLLVFTHQSKPATGSHPTASVTASTSAHLLIESYLQRSDKSFHVAALQADTGAVIWSYKLTQRNALASGVAITPGMLQTTVHNQVVYVAFAGKIYALQARTGKLIWQHDLHLSTIAGVNSTSSMIVDHGMLYLAYAGNNGLSTLYALNAQNGEQVWTHPIGIDQTFAANNGTVYIEINSSDLFKPGSVTALRGSDGLALWSYPTTPISMIVANNVLYIQSAHQQTAADQGGNKEYKPLLALDTTNGHLLWSVNVTDDGVSTLAFSNNLVILYRTTYQPKAGRFCAYHSSNGSPAWCTSGTQGPWDQDTSNELVANNTLFVSYAQGTDSTQSQNNPTMIVQALDPLNGHASWTKKLTGDATPSSLVEIDGTLYVQLDQTIVALNASSGHTLWQIPGQGILLSLMANA